MKLTDLFIKRPVLSIVVSLVILIAGLQSIRSLSVRQYRAPTSRHQRDDAYVAPTPTWCAVSSPRRSNG